MLKITLLLIAALTVPCALAARAAPQCTKLATGWNQLMRTGASVNGGVPLGTLFDSKAQPITVNGAPRVSNNPDFTSLIKVGDELYCITQFEAPNPSPVNLLKLNQDKTNGKLSVVSVTNVDTSSVGGTWTLCAGSVTPWNSHLGGEEYEPDARYFEAATCLYNATCGATSWEALDRDNFENTMDFVRYFGINATPTTTIDQVRAVFNPYKYGHTMEVKPGANSAYTVKKLYTTGRSAQELAYVMPDQKTVYITDDGERVAFFKFVANTAGDLSSGTLYAAKANQVTAENGGYFTITWIPLGSATQSELETMANGLKFSTIFETASPSSGACPSGFKSVNVGAKGQQCLKLKAGQEKAAAFFESRRYAAYLGATTEFSKWEGFTYSEKLGAAFTAMSEIRRGMEDNGDKGKNSTSYDIGGNNHVRLPYNPCGCVYRMAVVDNNIVSMSGFLCGTPTSNDPLNFCDINNISNPDNVAVMEDQQTLIIGEDTVGGHQNDVVWAYSLRTPEAGLSRILSTPYGSETTSPYFFPDLNGFAYMITVGQHPYAESDQNMANTTLNPDFEGDAGYLGYFTFKSSDIAKGYLRFDSIPAASTVPEKSKMLSTISAEIC